MAKDYLTLGPTPCDEKCEQLGDSYNPSRAKLEMIAYIAQLKRQFGTSSEIYFRVKSFPHDFGTYSEVVVWFDDLSEKSCQEAFEVENNLPAEWDEVAKQFLKENDY